MFNLDPVSGTDLGTNNCILYYEKTKTDHMIEKGGLESMVAGKTKFSLKPGESIKVWDSGYAEVPLTIMETDSGAKVSETVIVDKIIS